MGLSLVAAIARNGAIGAGGKLPWPRILGDMHFFRYLTLSRDPYTFAHAVIKEPDVLASLEAIPPEHLLLGQHRNACIMGWRTHHSIRGALLGRTSIVLRDTTYHGTGDWPCKARTFQEALDKAQEMQAPEVFAIGGSRVYGVAFQHPALERLYLTEIDEAYPEADIWMPLYTWDFDAPHAMLMPWFACDMFPEDYVEGSALAWQRIAVSEWQYEPERPRYRFGIWERL